MPKKLLVSLAFSYFWGLIAHGFAFSNINFSHDSLYEFYAGLRGNAVKMELGRIVTPFYRDVFGNDLTLPWLAGMLALFWIALAVYLIVKNIQN